MATAQSQPLMPSQSSATAKARPAFTLLELIIVLAIAGMLAAVAAVGIASSSQTREHRNAINHLSAQLRLARIAAMKKGEPVAVSISIAPDAIACEFADARTEIPARNLRIAAINGAEPPEQWEGLTFEPDGRTTARSIAFASAQTSDTLLPTIEFDPISGAIELGRAKDAPPRDQGGADR